MNLAITTPLLLLLLPLVLLPLIFPAQKSEGYPSLAVADTDTLSLVVDLLLRVAGAIAIAGLVLGLSGLHCLGQSIERLGEGANIVLLFDRSASMNDTFAGRPATGGEESKSAAARRFLNEFVASREHDRFGVTAFSTAPMFVLPLSDHKHATAAAIDAIELQGLALTDVGRGLAMAQAMQEADILATQGNDARLGSRAIVLVSDGAAVIDGKLQEKLRAAFAKRPLHLYWIFLRTEGSRGISDAPQEGRPDTPYAMPERYLNRFFESLKVPYQAFEAENPAAVGEAIAAIDKLERSPITYVERIPQRDLSGFAYAASAGALFLLLLAKLAETSVGAGPRSRVIPILMIAALAGAAVPSSPASAAELSREQVLALIAALGEDRAPDLVRRDLTGLDLSGVDFKRADLFAADLSGAAAKRDNATVAALLSGKDIEIDPATASPSVLFARAYFFLKRDRIDEAQNVLDQARLRADTSTRVEMLYDMANTRLRAAFDAIEQGQFDSATASVGLAKDQYTEALRLDPEAWDVKYNLDVASRLLRDLPEAPPPEDTPREAPKDIWTDLPGVPKGAP